MASLLQVKVNVVGFCAGASITLHHDFKRWDRGSLVGRWSPNRCHLPKLVSPPTVSKMKQDAKKIRDEQFSGAESRRIQRLKTEF
jgi:hypothetical protein